MSVTHLRYFDFSKNDKIRKTIVTKDIRYQYLIGQYGISFKDIRKVNAMYKCNKHCPQRNALYCGSNGGYVGPNCTCICPDGTFGQQCENGKLIVPYTESCTKKITKPGFIQTPSPRTVYEYCSWDIQAPADKIKVQVNFTEFKLINENNTTKLCEHEFLEIRKNESSHEGSYYCGEELNGQTVTSVGRNMKILMNPYASESYKDYVINKTKGFKAIVTFL
ncbi:hch-1 (predicted) [Pycnogonum litorale]